MTCWQRRIGSISGSAGAEPHGNSAKANRGEYDGAFISTQLTGGSEVNNTAAVNADLAGPEVDNLTVPIWFRRGRTIPRATAADRILMLTRGSAGRWPDRLSGRLLAPAGPTVHIGLPSLGLGGRAQAALGLDEADDAIEPLALLQIGHHERPLAPHPLRVGLHLLQRRTDMRREVDLVDHQQIRAGDARPALGGNLV